MEALSSEFKKNHLASNILGPQEIPYLQNLYAKSPYDWKAGRN